MSDELLAPGDTSPPPTDRPAWFSALDTTVSGCDLPPKYRLGMIVVAAAMVLLPLVYLGAIALAGWLLWWHATAHLESWQNSSFRFGLFYVTPLVLGGIGLLFMFKPFVARRPDDDA